MIPVQTIKSEKGLRDLIERNMRKEIHPGTKPSIDFIHKILDDAYLSGIPYDVSDLKPKLIAFASNSTNQSLYCLKTVQDMKFKSETSSEHEEEYTHKLGSDSRVVIYDIEVFPNLFVVCWKFEDADEVVKMINPTPKDIEALFKLKLVGFYNRRYDNHILWARFMGYNNEQLFKLSQKIIAHKDNNALFGEAYNISYTDIWDFASIKMPLKKWEIELGILHKELDLPWDEPVAEADIPKVVDYCVNDVIAAEAVFKARAADFTARRILAELSGLTVNHTTQQHTAKIIFGDNRRPQKEFIYTDLSKEFDGYYYDRGVSHYLGEVVGEGGYVYAEPGIYDQVALLDIASMHPTTIEILNLFGDDYTRKFSELKQARLAIKHKDYRKARKLLDGKLKPYLGSEEDSDALSYALKIVINIVYGLTSAKFDNAFRDVRNIDNIVAKRGALFMIDLKKAVQDKGFTVAHIKTDSIKIPNATPEIIKFVTEFGRNYGYTFEHEATYDKLALVNDAVYIAREGDKWTAVGTQFQHPYVYKTLFSHEKIEFADLCEAKSVTKGAIYIDFKHDKPKPDPLDMTFVGRNGVFVPVKEGLNGGVLYRVNEDKYYAVAGTKGYLWVEADVARHMNQNTDVNFAYFDKLVKDAISAISKFGSFEEFVSYE